MLPLCSLAQSNNLLMEFLEHFQKLKKKPNFTAVSLHGVPAGCGKKGNAAPRKRRKLETTTKRVDHFESMNTSPRIVVMSGATAGSASPVSPSLWILNREHFTGFSARTVVFIWKFLLHSYSMTSFLL